MIESIEREGTKVIIKINTGLNVEKHVLWFVHELQHEYMSELLKEHLRDLMCKHKDKLRVEAAKNPHFYLEPKEISKLKSKLVKEWNGSKHCWKRYEYNI